MKRSYLIAGALALAVATWLATGFLVDEDSPETVAATEPASTHAPVPAVQVRQQHAEPHARSIALYGRTEADRLVEVRVETGGRVAEKLVSDGQRVEAGDVLVRLAMDDREARLHQAEAWVRQRQTAYEASSSLRKDGFRAEVSIAEDLALLEESKAMLAAAKLDIERTEIRAPFAGIVEDIPVEVGDYMQSGGPDGSSLVARVVDLDPIIVICEVTERDATSVKIGSPASVRLVTGQELTGTVRFVARTASPTTRTFRVEIEVPNQSKTIPDGITAEVRLQVGETLAHRVSPSILTLSEEGAVGVKLVEDDIVAFRPVAIIDDTPDGMWLAGLPESVTFITVGQEFVRDGQRVRPQPELDGGTAVQRGGAS